MKNKPICNSMKLLVQELEKGGYHTGEKLGKSLDISRSAVWKFMTQLKEYGLDIQSVKPKGYCLKEDYIMLCEQKIRQYQPSLKDFKISIFESMPSTNTYLMQLGQEEALMKQVCLSELQTKGKARLGRLWQSPFGKNIYLSYLWPFERDVSALSGLSLAVGVILAKTLEEVGVKDVKIKWPNDLYVKAKKVAGILIEIKAESHGDARVVIGCGINVNMTSGSGVDQPWASVSSLLGQTMDRNKIVALYLENLNTGLALFEEKGLAAFMDDWSQFDYLKGRKIQLTHHKQLYSGEVMGVDEHGALLLKKGGYQMRFSSGDTSICK